MRWISTIWLKYLQWRAHLMSTRIALHSQYTRKYIYYNSSVVFIIHWTASHCQRDGQKTIQQWQKSSFFYLFIFSVNMSSVDCHTYFCSQESCISVYLGGRHKQSWHWSSPSDSWYIPLLLFVVAQPKCTGPSQKLQGSAAMTKHGHSSCQTEDKQRDGEGTTEERVMEEGDSNKPPESDIRRVWKESCWE